MPDEPRPIRAVSRVPPPPPPQGFPTYSVASCRALGEILRVRDDEEAKMDTEHRVELAQMTHTVAAYAHLMAQVDAARGRE